MKKLVATLLIGLSSTLVYALPVGNPSEASLLCEGLCINAEPFDCCHPWQTCLNALSLRVGFYGDYVFNRHMETERKYNHKVVGNCDVEHFDLTTNAGYLALNFFNRVDLFSTLGASSLHWNTNAYEFSSTILDERLDVSTETSFSWSVGARATLFSYDCFRVGLEGQFFTFNPEISRIILGEATTFYPGSKDETRQRYYEWQVGLGCSYRWNAFVPYMALQWSEACYNLDDVVAVFPSGDLAFLYKLQERKEIGYAVGCSLIDCERAALTIEGRFASEKALYINGQFRF